MTFLRRGNVAFPHRASAHVHLHRINGIPVQVSLKDVSCFEEHRYDHGDTLVVIYFVNGSNFSVRESFDTITKMVKSMEVAIV